MTILRLLMMAMLVLGLATACGDDDDDDDSGGVADDDAADDDATDDDATDDDATDDDATDDDATDDDATDDDATDDDALFEDDFNDYTAGAVPPSPWTTDVVGEGEVLVIEADDTSYVNCLEVDGSYVADEYTYATLPFTAVEADFTVAFEFWTDGGGVGFISLSEDGGTTWGASLGNIADGSLYGHNGNDWAEPCGTLTLSDWNTIVMTMHYADGTYDVELNGTTECSGLDPTNVDVEPAYNAFLLHDSISPGDGGLIYIDNILGELM